MADVSVIIPCYNGAEFVGQAIGSVLAQTDPVREVIVIDDGSTDDSAKVIKQFADRHVVLIEQDHQGESHARNKGIERASSELIALLDADDVWTHDKVKQQVQALEAMPEAVAVHSRVFNFERDLDDRQREQTEKTKDDPDVSDLLAYHYVTPSTLMVRRSVLVEHSIEFDPSVRHSEDMLFTAHLRLAGPLRLVDQPLTAKRIHGGQQSSDRWHPIWSLCSRVNWCRQYAQKIGPDTAKNIDQQLGDRMIQILEDRFWRREIGGLT
jgi:glycosyltransferase involved in cell wall biosynthesis